MELDQLFYRSSHDFRRPITSLMGLNQLAEMSIEEKNALELFGKVKETANGMDKMVEKFMMLHDISKFTFRHNANHELFNVENKIGELATQNGRKTNIKFDIKVNNYEVSDPRNFLIELILTNLVENAISYNRQEIRQVLISMEEVEEQIIINTRDNGQGIPEELMHRVYDMYFRGNLSSSGNGLGLYVVKKAVDKLKGDIQLKSKINEYTNVIVSFPI